MQVRKKHPVEKVIILSNHCLEHLKPLLHHITTLRCPYDLEQDAVL